MVVTGFFAQCMEVYLYIKKILNGRCTRFSQDQISSKITRIWFDKALFEPLH